MALSFAEVLQVVYGALKGDKYQEKLGKVDEYEVTVCGLEEETNSWKGNLRYSVVEGVEVKHARFSIDAESGEIVVFVLGKWDWHIEPSGDLGLGE